MRRNAIRTLQICIKLSSSVSISSSSILILTVRIFRHCYVQTNCSQTLQAITRAKPQRETRVQKQVASNIPGLLTSGLRSFVRLFACLFLRQNWIGWIFEVGSWGGVEQRRKWSVWTWPQVDKRMAMNVSPIVVLALTDNRIRKLCKSVQSECCIVSDTS